MKDLLLYIARSLVEHPEQVSVTEVEEGDELTLQLRVAPEDMGKVIGVLRPQIVGRYDMGKVSESVKALLS